MPAFGIEPARPPRGQAFLAAALDGLWVLGSVLLQVAGVLPLSAAGKWSILLIALMVETFATLQVYGTLRHGARERDSPPERPCPNREPRELGTA
jgi:hypothetical protein